MSGTRLTAKALIAHIASVQSPHFSRFPDPSGRVSELTNQKNHVVKIHFALAKAG
jgi:hypothetical protein